MMVEKIAKTIEEAVRAALSELNVTEEQADIEILEEPTKGILGFMAKPARVKVTKKITHEVAAEDFLRQIFDKMKLKVEIEFNKTEEYLYVNFKGADLGILIGRRGETLDALQYLTNLAVNKQFSERIKIILDVEDYRKRREETLINLALRLCDKVKRTGYNVTLEPMNPHERRIIHTALQNDKRVTTFSEGDEPYRKVVISLKK